MSYVNIEGEILDVEVQDRKYPTVSHGDREWYVFQDSESAGEAARGYWEEMARTDPDEFTYIVGQRNLVAWALGMWAGPGSKQVTSLKDWLDLWLGTPEEQWASYDGEEVEGTVSREAMGELGFKNKSVVFYRVS